jgi:hypothetical protein
MSADLPARAALSVRGGRPRSRTRSALRGDHVGHAEPLGMNGEAAAEVARAAAHDILENVL